MVTITREAILYMMLPGLFGGILLSVEGVRKALTDIRLCDLGRVFYGAMALLIFASTVMAWLVGIAEIKPPEHWRNVAYLAAVFFVGVWVISVWVWWPRLPLARERQRRIVAREERDSPT